MKNYRQHIKTLETGNDRSMVVTSSFAGFPFLNGGFMLAEVTVLLGSITHNVPVTPNFFNYLLNLQKDPTTFADIIIGIRLAVYQLIDFVLSVTAIFKKEEVASKPVTVKASNNLNIDDPTVLSASIFAQGLKLKKDSDYENALLAFEQYRMYHPEDPSVYFELADCNFALDINDKAMTLVDHAISLDPEYGEAIGLKGCLLTMNKEFQTALYFLHIGNTLAPNTENILCGLYLVYTEFGMLKSAMTCLQQLIAVNPFEVSYLHNQAVLYECFGQLDKAIGAMQIVVSQCPDEMQYTEYLYDLEQRQGEKVSSFYVGMNN
jgi:tetratricopeptide (TPR) repeat protein